jgi:hypothetical protein
MTVTFRATASVHRSLRERLLSFPVVLAGVLATCVFLFVPRSMADPDIWWHLRNAQYQIGTHSFITRDMYSFTTPGAPWMDHEWLAEVPFYLGWRVMGSRGLFLVTAMAIEFIFLGVFYLACRHAKNPKAALLPSVIAAFLATVSFGPRTLLFGWICLVAELLVLDRYLGESPRVFRKVLWMLPLLFGIWVNTHGSWIIGMVVLTGFLACGCFRISIGAIESKGWTREQMQVLAAATGLSLASLFLNPYGWRLVAYPFNLAFRQKLNIANVDEWVTLDFHSVRGHVFLVSLTLVFFAQLFRSRKWAVYEFFFLFIGVYSAFTYSRFLFLAAILIFPLIAKDLAAIPAYRPEQNKPWLNGVILLVLLGVCVHHFPPRAEEEAFGDHAFPDHALDFLHGFQPQGNVLNDYLWGGYLEWHARQIPVFIDSRVDIFEYGGVFKDYLDAIRSKDSLAILDKYKIRYVLFERDAPLVYLLQQTHAWKVDYQDKSTILLERISAHSNSAAEIDSAAVQHE